MVRLQLIWMKKVHKDFSFNDLENVNSTSTVTNADCMSLAATALFQS